MNESHIAYDLIVVLGPTATGKTRFASELAALFDGEIIGADSRQIYRQMNLGTGKDYEDYRIGDLCIPYHLIDIHEPGYRYNVFKYQQDFLRAFITVQKNGKIPILCGGTGLYIEAVTRGYKLISVPVNESLRKKLKNKSLEDLEQILKSYRRLHNQTDTDTIKRAIRAIEIEAYYADHFEMKYEYPEIRPIYLGIFCDREIRLERITNRLHTRLNNGMIEEVEHLLQGGLSPDDLIYYGLEYKYITLYLTGKLDYDTMVNKLNVAIHQFAKRQMTWFRKMEKKGINIHWIDAQLPMTEKIQLALKILKK